MIFSLFDTIILTIISIFTLHGLYRGFIQISVNLLSLIVSIILTMTFYPYVKTIFSDQLKNELFTSIFSGIVTYLLLFIITNIISAKILSLLEPVRLNILDRILGMFLGFLKSGVIAIIVFAFIISFTNNSPKIVKIIDLFNINQKEYPRWIKSSETVPYLEDYLKKILRLMPNTILQTPIKYNKNSSNKNIDNVNQNNNIIEKKDDKIVKNIEDEDDENEKNIVYFIKNLLLKNKE